MKLKAILLSFALILPADAQTNPRIERCGMLETAARATMTARQTGKSMLEVRRSSEKLRAESGMDPELSRLMGNLMDALLIDAYERPRFSSDESQQRAIEDFANTYYLQCFKDAKEQE